MNDSRIARIARAHAGYHGGTQDHREPDVLVDDTVTHRMLAPHLVRVLLFLVTPTVLTLLWLLLGYLAAMSSPSRSGEVIQGLLGFGIVVLFLLGVAAFFAPAREPIAEHARLLEGAAGAAEGAGRWVRESAAARRLPVGLAVRDVGGVQVLEFRQHAERAMLLVQPYGADLYIGWTMWRSRSPALLLVHFLRDTFGRVGSGPRFSAELRAASTRALREAVHSLAREAAVLATGPVAAPRTADATTTATPPRGEVEAGHPSSAAADAPWLRPGARVSAPGSGGSVRSDGWGPGLGG